MNLQAILCSEPNLTSPFKDEIIMKVKPGKKFVETPKNSGVKKFINSTSSSSSKKSKSSSNSGSSEKTMSIQKNSRKRKYSGRVKRACENCKKGKRCCDEGRPCNRCIRLGLESTCKDAKRKNERNSHSSQNSNSCALSQSASYPSSYKQSEEGRLAQLLVSANEIESKEYLPPIQCSSYVSSNFLPNTNSISSLNHWIYPPSLNINVLLKTITSERG